jgi:hypothetical protein
MAIVRKRIVVTLMLALSALSCSEKPAAEKQGDSLSVRIEHSMSLRDQMDGEWYNLSMVVDFNAGDTMLSKFPDMRVDSANWEQTLQIKPIHTTFRSDSTWSSIYRNLADSIVRDVSGIWWFEGDTLVYRTLLPQPYPDERFLTRIDGNVVTFEGYLDFDQDGSMDDHYLGTQRKK